VGRRIATVIVGVRVVMIVCSGAGKYLDNFCGGFCCGDSGDDGEKEGHLVTMMLDKGRRDDDFMFFAI
jgi:hypothetical protein